MIEKGHGLKFFWIVALMVAAASLKAQSIEADTLQAPAAESVQIPELVHSPKKATIYSAILPGLGQAYNKKYWKIPLIYIGFGTIGYFIDWNNDNYQLFKTGYKHLVDTDPATQDYLKIEAVRRNNYDLNNPTQFNNLKTALIKQQDYYRRNRDLLIISIIGFYGLNIIDASVDAHFFDFDISDDLTMKWQPTLRNVDNSYIYCVNLSFKF